MKTLLKVWVSISLIAIGIGIALLILAAGTGEKWERDLPTFSMDESYTGVQKLDIDISYGNVKIVEGTEFSITAENIIDDGIESSVSDGTWTIRDRYNRVLNVFSWHIPYSFIFHWDDEDLPELVITIPKGFTADNIKLNVGAGKVDADTINTVDGEFSVDAGDLEIDKLVISGNSQYNVDAGVMVLRDLTAKDIAVNCGVGKIDISGMITGDSDISCDIGKVELALKGNEDNYNYDINVDLGHINIDDNSYNSISDKVVTHNDAENNLNLDCGIGNISVEFE